MILLLIIWMFLIMDYIISDLEGTLTTGSSWKAIRHYYQDNINSWRYNIFFLSWLPRYLMVALGWLSRKKAISDWMAQEAALFKGWSRQEFERMADWIVDSEMWPERRTQVLEEIIGSLSGDVQLLVVSSGYQPIVSSFAKVINAIPIGTPLIFDSDGLRGITVSVNAYEHKVTRIHQKVTSGNIIAAYGDTISDLPMLELAQIPIAVYPDKPLRRIALDRGWRIIDDKEIQVTSKNQLGNKQ